MAKKTFGARLKQLRQSYRYERVGLTQTELAKRAGIDRQAVNQLENGRSTNPEMATVLKLARALGVKASALIDPE